MKYLALFVVGAASLRPSRCNQDSRDFFHRLLVVSSKFLQKAFVRRSLHFFVISTLIFCSLCLTFFIFCVSFFVGGLLLKKDVCMLDFFIILYNPRVCKKTCVKQIP